MLNSEKYNQLFQDSRLISLVAVKGSGRLGILDRNMERPKHIVSRIPVE